MIPGSISKYRTANVVAATTIGPFTGEVVIVTGTTTIQTITPAYSGQFSHIINLFTPDGAVTLGTSGNILVGLNTVANRVTRLVWIPTLAKWVL